MPGKWHFYSLLQGKPGCEQLQYLDERVRELKDTGVALDELVTNDPVGLLGHLGVVCVYGKIQLDDPSINAAALQEDAQQVYSVQILEEDCAVEQPEWAAEALLSWVQANLSKSSCGDVHPSHDLDSFLCSTIARQMSATSSAVSLTSGSSSGSHKRFDL